VKKHLIAPLAIGTSVALMGCSVNAEKAPLPPTQVTNSPDQPLPTQPSQVSEKVNTLWLNGIEQARASFKIDHKLDIVIGACLTWQAVDGHTTIVRNPGLVAHENPKTKEEFSFFEFIPPPASNLTKIENVTLMNGAFTFVKTDDNGNVIENSLIGGNYHLFAGSVSGQIKVETVTAEISPDTKAQWPLIDAAGDPLIETEVVLNPSDSDISQFCGGVSLNAPGQEYA
jgi:hypothetical protein